MKVIKCLNCKSLFPELEIIKKRYEDHCPFCVCGNLLDEKKSTDEAWYKEDLLRLWLLFGDIPIDDADRILEPFMDWPEGTNRFDIWHWFDEKYPGGIHTLMEEVEA